MRYIASIGISLLAATAVQAQSTVCVSAPPWVHPYGDNVGNWASISRDGRFVAFVSPSEFLVPNDTNSDDDAFVWDRLSGQIERVSFDTDGSEVRFVRGSAVSDDGQSVAYYAGVFAPDSGGAYVRNRATDTTVFLNKRADGTPSPETQFFLGRISISPSGRFVAFDSVANLMDDAGDLVRQVYVHDRDIDGNGIFDEPGGFKIILASVSTDGAPSNGESQYPDISPDGRFVTFASFGTNLVEPDINGDRDVYVHDRDVDADGVFDEPGQILTERVSVASNGQQAMGIHTFWSSISADGRYVVYHSSAPNLVPNDTNAASDVFLHDRMTHETTRLSTSQNGSQSAGTSALPDLSDDGRFVTYISKATDVFPNDTEGFAWDVVVLDRLNRSKKHASYTPQHLPSGGMFGGHISEAPCASVDARFVVLVGYAGDLAPSVPEDNSSVYLRDRGPHHLADIDGAGFVNINDLLAVIVQWGPCPAAPMPCAADLNGDGTVNINDLLMVIINWG